MTISIREIDDATIAAYQADGVVLLRGAFADWVEPLRAGVAALDDRDALLRDRVDARLYIRDHDSLLLDRDLDARVSTMDRMALSIKARALVRSLDRDLLRGRCLTVSSVPVLETASLLIKNKIKNIRPVL